MYVPVADHDLGAVVSLMNRAYRGRGVDAGWTTEAGHLEGDRITVDLLRADLSARPRATFLKWIVEPEGPPHGCVWLEPLDQDSWYLGSLAIDPALQNGGLGRTMLSAAEDRVRGRNGRTMEITVINVRDTLIAWYERRGYRRTGETRPFPYGDDRFGTPLRDDLCFVVLAKSLL